jgi:hypothetical protein
MSSAELAPHGKTDTFALLYISLESGNVELLDGEIYNIDQRHRLSDSKNDKIHSFSFLHDYKLSSLSPSLPLHELHLYDSSSPCLNISRKFILKALKPKCLNLLNEMGQFVCFNNKNTKINFLAIWSHEIYYQT